MDDEATHSSEASSSTSSPPRIPSSSSDQRLSSTGSGRMDPTVAQGMEKTGSTNVVLPLVCARWGFDNITAAARTMTCKTELTTSVPANHAPAYDCTGPSLPDLSVAADHFSGAFCDNTNTFAIPYMSGNIVTTRALDVPHVQKTCGNEVTCVMRGAESSRHMGKDAHSSSSSLAGGTERCDAHAGAECHRASCAMTGRALLHLAQQELAHKLALVEREVADLHQAVAEARAREVDMQRRLQHFHVHARASDGHMGGDQVEDAHLSSNVSPDPTSGVAIDDSMSSTSVSASASSSASSSSLWLCDDNGDDEGMHEDMVDALESSILKNRPVMAREEVGQWEGTLGLAGRAKDESEREMAGNEARDSSKPRLGTGWRDDGQEDNGGNVRSTVRASLSSGMHLSPRSGIRKGRKTKTPTRSLAPGP